MKFYFENFERLNLDHIDQVRNVRSYHDFFVRNSNFGIEFTSRNEFDIPGIYPIEVSKLSHLWCLKSLPESFSILYEIPFYIIDLVKQRKLRIAVISVVEGDSFVNEILDCYRALTDQCKALQLPRYSVVIVSGNLEAETLYKSWCIQNNELPWMEFIEGIEWTGEVWKKLDEPIFYKSIKEHSLLYNSLNRAHREHRTDHLCYLTKNNLLDLGLVTGGVFINEHNIEIEKRKILENYFPRFVDEQTEGMISKNFAGISNLNIFKNTLLTVSTETFFSEPGLFITEKTFRPIAMGHPFIILGQPNILKKLNSMGYRTDFLDEEYDSILDHSERFSKFHESFLKWINADKQKYFSKWLTIVEHNQYIYNRSKYRKKYLENLVNSTTRYFKEYS